MVAPSAPRLPAPLAPHPAAAAAVVPVDAFALPKNRVAAHLKYFLARAEDHCLTVVYRARAKR